MSSAASPLSNLATFASVPPHPVVEMVGITAPFTLLKNADGITYQLRFSNATGAAVRIFAMGYSTSATNPLWTNMALLIPASPPAIYDLQFTAANLNGSTNLWLGVWWDNIYGTPAAYFAAHPSGGSHHTVPIVVG